MPRAHVRPLARDIATVGAATLASRVLGFARDAGVAALIGAGPVADAYFAAMQAPNLARRLLSEGALNPALAPLWHRLPPERRRDFAGNALSLMAAVAAAKVIVAILIAAWIVRVIAPGFEPDTYRFALAIAYLTYALPYVALAGIAATAAALLNAQHRVGAPAASVLAFNVVLLVAVGLAFATRDNSGALAAAVLALSFVAAGLVQVAVVVAALMRSAARPRGFSLKPSPETRAFFLRAMPGLVAAGIPQFALIGGAMIASPAPAAVAWLYYAYRLYELPLGLVAAVTSAVMTPHLAAGVAAQGAAQTDDPPLLGAVQRRAFELAIGLALPAALGLAILAQPIARALFEHGAFGSYDTEMVAAALAALALGLPGHALEKVLGAISFAHHDTMTPMQSALAGFVVAICGAFVLFATYGHVGVAAALATGGWVASAILGLRLRSRGWLHLGAPARRTLLAIVAASGAMAGTLAAIVFLVTLPAGALAQAFALAGLIVLGLAVYAAALRAFGVIDPAALIAAMRGD